MIGAAAHVLQGEAATKVAAHEILARQRPELLVVPELPHTVTTEFLMTRGEAENFLLWEFTINTTLTVSPEQRERLLKERGAQ